MYMYICCLKIYNEIIMYYKLYSHIGAGNQMTKNSIYRNIVGLVKM